MGFRSGSFARVWSVEPISETRTKIRISVSRRNKETNEWVQDFSGFVMCLGSAVAKKAAKLKPKDRIVIGDVDVTTRYNAETKENFTNFSMFSFKMDGETDDDNNKSEKPRTKTQKHEVGDGDVDDSASDDDLPW